MNETLKIIKSRRSTRAFMPKQLKDSDLQDILDAGIFAPSASNNQPWHFTVIQNKNIIDKLSIDFKEIAKKSESEYLRKVGENENFHVFYNAPTVILVSGDKNNKSASVDCAAALENMLIAAESIEIGSCWVGFIAYLFNSEKGAEIGKDLGIPQGFKQIHSVCLGYKKNGLAIAPVRKENIVNYIK